MTARRNEPNRQIAHVIFPVINQTNQQKIARPSNAKLIFSQTYCSRNGIVKSTLKTIIQTIHLPTGSK